MYLVLTSDEFGNIGFVEAHSTLSAAEAVMREIAADFITAPDEPHQNVFVVSAIHFIDTSATLDN